MNINMNDQEGAALHGLLQETSGDIVLRLDEKGFIRHASDNIKNIGYDLSQMLLLPHIADLAEIEYTEEVSAYTTRVFETDDGGNAIADWLEFPIGQHCEEKTMSFERRRAWYALSLRTVRDDGSEVTGALGLLRSVERLRALEGEVFSRALFDPLTGLANRHAFRAALRRQISSDEGGTVALFEVDRMRAIFMQYGQRTADEIIWGFAKFLEAMVQPGYELAQFDGERFCVILPGQSGAEARRWAQEVLQTFGSLTVATSSKTPQLSATAGLTRIESCVDQTLKQAEVSLVMARARGGMQVAECEYPDGRRKRSNSL
ncbi:MAG: GGDEF domain-containing protein [Pseudomonadota bacterium]|nr:GGDEF domain-containing protein [Pseudomonadota bacterium]